jgi:hypothetical protein
MSWYIFKGDHGNCHVLKLKVTQGLARLRTDALAHLSMKTQSIRSEKMDTGPTGTGKDMDKRAL